MHEKMYSLKQFTLLLNFLYYSPIFRIPAEIIPKAQYGAVDYEKNVDIDSDISIVFHKNELLTSFYRIWKLTVQGR